MSPRFQGENFQRNLDLVGHIERLAAARNVTAAQLALAWLLARAPHIVPIPGTRSEERLAENIGAVDIALSAEELQAIDAVAPRGAAAGERYPAANMRQLNG
jgi:aryl-alcohol dehydrogenase-like predicted oxidoreductase